MENKPIAVANFHVFGTLKDYKNRDVDVDKVITLELHKSGAFQYGNGTCVVWIDKNGGYEQGFDTRYDKRLRRDGSNFTEWGYNHVRDYIADDLTVERM